MNNQPVDNFAIYDTIFGKIQINYTERAITGVRFIDYIADKGIESELSHKAIQQLAEFFDGQRQLFDLPIKIEGTEFQKKVWKSLMDIPYGETRSYKEIAETIGNPKASRAVGNANNKNPIQIIIPCHRVIGTKGLLVGYAAGINTKKLLLELEQK